MRNSFISHLVKLARINPNIALIVGDLGYSVIEPFAEEFPDRFINAGVAEQNMAGLAAGMASEGYQVFCYSIANFPTFRCAEQIRNDICYHNLAVTIVSVGGGLAYGNLGFSHHAVQDYALLRSMPNMTIASPGDPLEVEGCLDYIVSNSGPFYLRLGKTGEDIFHSKKPSLEVGQWQKIRGTSEDFGIVSTGTALQIAVRFAEQSSEKDISLFSCPLWNSDVKAHQYKNFGIIRHILSVEDHLIDGGFGSWLLESIQASEDKLSKFQILGLQHQVLNMVASEKTLLDAGGLSFDHFDEVLALLTQ
jgi:transketolase